MTFAQRAKTAFELLFRPSKASDKLVSYFQMLDGYTPIFSTYDGGVYEMELTRSCIHAFANHVSKLRPIIGGADLRGYQRILDERPNPFMTCSQFLYKAATIYDAKNTVWIVPILDAQDNTIGFYPTNPDTVELVDVGGVPYVRYTFADGSKAAIELERVGVVSKFLYTSDLVGENNSALNPTMQLLDTQNKGITEGIKNSAAFRFMATYSDFADEDDLKTERKNFVEKNFGPDSGGLALFPHTFTNVQQIQSTAKIVDPEQVSSIEKRVFEYFGCNEDVLMNKCYGDAWSAYYEGKIEPFALQLSQAMTCMAYTEIERARANRIEWSSNRLQYMSNADKLQVSSQMFDRGIFTQNMINDIWNLPHVEGGDQRYIRREYVEVDDLGADDTGVTPVQGGNSNDT